MHSATPQNYSSGNATALSNLVPQLNNKNKRTQRNLPLENQNGVNGPAGVSPLNLTSDDAGARTEQLYARERIATTKAGGEDGSMLHRRDRRFFQKKDLQLQTTLRKNGNNPPSNATSAANGMFILSPE